MRLWAWLSSRIRPAAARLWRWLLRRAAAAATLLLFVCCCIYLHLRSIPEKFTAQELLVQHLQRESSEAFASVLASMRALRIPLLELMRILGALLLDAASLFLLWVKFVYPVVAPLVATGIRLYIELQPQQQLLIAASAAALPLFYFLRVSTRVKRMRAVVTSFYSGFTAYVAAGAPLALTVLLHCCCCLVLGIPRLTRFLSVVWLPLPLLGTALFAVTNFDVFRSIFAVSPGPSAAALAPLEADTPGATAIATALCVERRLRALRSLTCWLMLWFLQGLGCMLSSLLLTLPLPVSFQAYIEAAPLHLLLSALLLGVLTGGSSSLILFAYGHKCVGGLAAALNLFSRKFFGIQLLLPKQQRQQQQQLLLRAQAQQKLLTSATAPVIAARAKKASTGTLQLAQTFRLDAGEVLMQHCLPDFSPLEETQQEQQQAASANTKSVLQRLRSAAVVALRISPPTSSGNSAEASAGMQSSSFLGSRFQLRSWRVLLQQVLQQTGFVVSPSVLYVITAAKVLSSIAKLDPPEPPASPHQKQLPQTSPEDAQSTLSCKGSSGRIATKGKLRMLRVFRKRKRERAAPTSTVAVDDKSS
ncbi:uncharacterized protein LOC34623976 [Cyclospora cayetanensis]|uniref:Uncharacterized protein LOC34623976 n=1 Tax=Cyclospora cayetanensis TaxID=88456 RepID=A0A6P6S3D4_9EIME|nr:uncharacterized protein LOC34623976 [Cyclospora cayetanensis]